MTNIINFADKLSVIQALLSIRRDNDAIDMICDLQNLLEELKEAIKNENI